MADGTGEATETNTEIGTAARTARDTIAITTTTVGIPLAPENDDLTETENRAIAMKTDTGINGRAGPPTTATSASTPINGAIDARAGTTSWSRTQRRLSRRSRLA
jgi:hypothetical protein